MGETIYFNAFLTSGKFLQLLVQGHIRPLTVFIIMNYFFPWLPASCLSNHLGIYSIYGGTLAKYFQVKFINLIASTMFFWHSVMYLQSLGHKHVWETIIYQSTVSIEYTVIRHCKLICLQTLIYSVFLHCNSHTDLRSLYIL